MKTKSTHKSSLRVAIIGSGNVATQFGKVLQKNLVGIAGRNQKEVKKLSKALNTQALSYSYAVALSDVIILAVSDDAIPNLVREFFSLEVFKDKKESAKIFVHTSGPVDMDVFKDFKNVGIIYPLQSLNKKVDLDFKNVPLLIEASNKKSLTAISELAHTMSTNVHKYSSEQRAIIHLSAVFANNFTNHLTTLAYKILEQHKIKPEVLLPLILQSVEKLKKHHPSTIQTGPAKRGDKSTMNKHLQLLKNDAHIKEVYTLLSKSIAKKV